MLVKISLHYRQNRSNPVANSDATDFTLHSHFLSNIMSRAIALKQLTRYFCIYIVASLFVYLITSFSSPAWLIAIFILVEASFPIAVMLYLIAIVIFLATLRIHKVAE